MVLEVTVGLAALVLWALARGLPPARLAREGPGTGGYLLFFYGCLAPVLVPLTVAFVRHFDRRDVASLGARLPAGGWGAAARQAVAVGLGVAGLLGVWLGGVALVGRVHLAGLAAGFSAGPAWLPGPLGGGAVLGLTLLGFLVGGAVEEWVFRGYVFRVLRERWSWATAAGASALTFALFHGLNPDVDPAALVNTFLLGVALAALVEGSGSLIAPSLAHGLWNFLMGSVLSVPVSGLTLSHLLDLEVAGPPWLTGAGYGPEGSWLLTGLLLPLILGLALWVDRRKESGS
jgi:membrane protease YdiL (CAAX protease family)